MVSGPERTTLTYIHPHTHTDAQARTDTRHTAYNSRLASDNEIPQILIRHWHAVQIECPYLLVLIATDSNLTPTDSNLTLTQTDVTYFTRTDRP